MAAMRSGCRDQYWRRLMAALAEVSRLVPFSAAGAFGAGRVVLSRSTFSQEKALQAMVDGF